MRSSTTWRARALVCAGALALVAAACGDDDGQGADTTATTTSDQATTMPGHSHDDLYEVAEGAPQPTLTVVAHEDPKSGWNLELQVTNFRFAPEKASTDATEGEGHAHVYVDGEKLGRIYTEWYHLGPLDPGEHEVRVELSANDHRAVAVGGEKVEHTLVVEQVGTPQAGHMHPDPVDAGAPAPAVALEVTPDAKSGFNVHVEVEGLTFAPEHASTEHMPGEGHAHLYVDGEKITRLYGEWYHLPAMTEGEHEVMVELSANDHSPLASDGRPITDSLTVVQPADGAAPGGGGPSTTMPSTTMTPGDGAPGDTAPDADVVLEATVAGGSVTEGGGRQEIPIGSTVALVVTADVDDEIHLHGYDLHADTVPGQPSTLSFTANIPGVFEVEMHGDGLPLWDLEVS